MSLSCLDRRLALGEATKGDTVEEMAATVEAVAAGTNHRRATERDVASKSAVRHLGPREKNSASRGHHQRGVLAADIAAVSVRAALGALESASCAVACLTHDLMYDVEALPCVLPPTTCAL